MSTGTAVRRSTPWHTGSRVWHAVLAAVIAASLVVQLVLLFAGGADANSGDTGAVAGLGTRVVRLFSYFTIQSNLIALAVALTLAANPARDGRGWRVARLDALLGIMITGLVFGLVLAPSVHLEGAARWATIGFHYVAPWMTLLGWLLFGPRPRLDWATVGRAFAWPALWIAYTFTHGAITHWYPYPFLDVTRLGIGPALRNTLLVLLAALILAAAFKALDRLRSKVS